MCSEGMKVLSTSQDIASHKLVLNQAVKNQSHPLQQGAFHNLISSQLQSAGSPENFTHSILQILTTAI